jgi:hypothetical protein
MSEQPIAKPHDMAAGQINSWRGHCLDLFAKAERAIASALEAACDKNPSLTIKHLAGHRLADLARIVTDTGTANEKRSKALLDALAAWQCVDAKRAFLAHGVSTVLLDRHGAWHVQLDFTRYQSKRRDRERWSLSELEAAQFEDDLEQKFKLLSTQLGQFRKGLTA